MVPVSPEGLTGAVARSTRVTVYCLFVTGAWNPEGPLY